jgi:hypothetical protein
MEEHQHHDRIDCERQLVSEERSEHDRDQGYERRRPPVSGVPLG